ncbi:MAG: T9SS type A sorting domain-containing protein [Hymenobacter sp.]|nr:MAG: T9SS type A sorting domain-containing protein [Hymenobacter sp.]
MDRFLLSMACLALLAMGSARTGRAQTIFAGQVAGATYTDVVPDKELFAERKSGMVDSQVEESMDLNGDGIADIKIELYVNAIWTGGQSSTAYCRIYPLHANVALPISEPSSYSKRYYNPGLTKRTLGEAIQSELVASGSMKAGVWVTGPTDLLDANHSFFVLSEGFYGYNSPVGAVHTGFWYDGQDGYLPVRLRANSTAPWQYGWVRLQAPGAFYNNSGEANFGSVSVIIKDYALSNTVLAAQTAQAAGWQIYPTQVTDQLTFEPPTPTGQSQVTVGDLCGRAIAHAVVSGRRQQLSLAGLAAGVYIVQLDTPAGHFVQRITKQ